MRTTDAVLESLREARRNDRLRGVGAIDGWRSLRVVLAHARTRAGRPALTEEAVRRALVALASRELVEERPGHPGTWRARA